MRIILLCWVVPIVLTVFIAAFLLRSNYERNVRTLLETDAGFSIQQVEERLNMAFTASKAVSYDGTVRNAWRSFQQDGDSAALYRSVNDYLTQTFARSESYYAVFIDFWAEDLDIFPYIVIDGTVGDKLLRSDYRNIREDLMTEMSEADTAIRLLEYGGNLYVARNLLDSKFRPYATVVMLCDNNWFFGSLDELRLMSTVTLTLDELTLDQEGRLFRTDRGLSGPLDNSGAAGAASDAGGSDEKAGGNTAGGDRMVLEGELEDHTLLLTAEIAPYHIFQDNPQLKLAIPAILLLSVPLLLLMLLFFRAHVTKPVEQLLEATDRLQGGERGYQIAEPARDQEFERIFRHFNQMSAELQNQFERSLQEEQALQEVRIKALQSQINPHFLNNTLEIINWEARIANNERVSAMIEALSVMMDASLVRDGRGKVHLREEFSYVDAYLYIIGERLGSRLEVIREIDESLLDEMVPRLIFQPLVENAVEHDITPRRGGRLFLRAYRDGELLVLENEHDGTMSGEDMITVHEMLSSEEPDSEITGQMGLRNVKQRLKLMYGDRGSISMIQSGPDQILARVTIPISKT